MAIVKYTETELNNLARLMRAEAVGDGDLGMLMVGNVVVNRTLANCYTFTNKNNINDIIYQTPGGFAGIRSNLYYSNPTIKEKELAQRVLNGEYYYPATNALWFYAPKLMKIVHHYGMNKEMLEDIKVIVFMNLILVFVKR